MLNAEENKPIVVGVDGSNSSIDALRKAAEISKVLGHPIKAIIAWDYPALAGFYVAGVWEPDRDAQEILDTSIAEAFETDVPHGLTRSVRRGSPARVLVEESAGAEMLVVGSRGRGGFTGLLLGSVGAESAEHAGCPVLVVHSDSQREAHENEDAAVSHAR